MKKGSTLVEVLVSITVFAIIMMALFTSVFAMRRTLAKQEALVRFDMLGCDLAFVGEAGAQGYLGAENLSYNESTGLYTAYFDGKYAPSAEGDGVYRAEFSFSEGEVSLSVYYAESGSVIFQNIVYGGRADG